MIMGTCVCVCVSALGWFLFPSQSVFVCVCVRLHKAGGGGGIRYCDGPDCHSTAYEPKTEPTDPPVDRQ